jgi:hypothetical protein
MLVALAACGTNAPQETSVPEVTAHYRDAGYYTEDNTLVTIDYYDENGHIIGDEVYDNGVLTTYELFQKTENYSFEIPELEDSPDVVSTEYMELFTRPAEEGNEYHSSGMVFVFGYDANDHMRMAKVFALADDGAILFTYVIYYQLDDHGNFTGWTHMTENGDVLFEMQADLVYDGDQLTEGDYHYTRYGTIIYADEQYQYQKQKHASSYTLHLVFEY